MFSYLTIFSISYYVLFSKRRLSFPFDGSLAYQACENGLTLGQALQVWCSVVQSFLSHCCQDCAAKVSKGAKIRSRYNQVPHLTQDTNGKVTNSQLDTTNESQEVSPFPAGDHKAHINRRAGRHSKHKTEQKHKRSTKEVPPWNGQLNILLEGLNRFNSAPTSPLIQMWIKTHIYLACIKDP